MRPEQFMPSSPKEPDTFHSREVQKSEIFRFGYWGSIVGAIVFGLLGYLISYGNIDLPYMEYLADAGPLILILAFAMGGVLLMALLTSLMALYKR